MRSTRARRPSSALARLGPAFARLVAHTLVIATLAILAPAVVAQPDDGARPRVGDDALRLTVRGSPLLTARIADGGRVTVAASVPGPTDLRIRIADFDGRTVRRLHDGAVEAGTITRRWDGRDEAGRPQPAGPYRAIAVAGRGEDASRAEAWITLAERKVYPRRPGFITVVLDAGHGGPRPGAQGPDGTREADLNVDIALRAAAMLEGAGVDVVLTRDEDEEVNEPPVDRTGDGLADDTDELAARNDIANLARADLFISVHNNTALNTRVGGPSTFFSDERTFRARSARLARIIQGEMMAALEGFASGGWQPFDHGALTYPYYVLRDHDPPRLQRPTQMPAVLSEGLFLSNPRELRLLKRPAVRSAMAVAYYDAIAKYLARRTSHLAYELVAGPVELPAGAEGVLEIELRNAGTVPARGWRLAVGAVRDPFLYEGRGRRGAIVGERRMPRLEPGERTTIRVRITAPERPGAWMLIADASDRSGTRLSRLGVPPLQVPLVVTEPLPSPSPSVLPSSLEADASPAT